MNIHTVKAGDTIFKIARMHGVSPMQIVENNGLENPDKLSVGQKLLILNPTRTYTVRAKDSLENIASRFGVKYSDLIANNPYLYGGGKIYPGQVLAVKFDAPRYAMASANGYCYKGYSEDALNLAMPYLTYVTVANGRRRREDVEILFDEKNIMNIARRERKLTLMRIYDDEVTFTDRYIQNILSALRKSGYSGVTIAAYRALKENMPGLEEFLIRLKRELLEENMQLFLEIDGNNLRIPKDICDGYVLMYEKCALDEIPTTELGERRVMREFSELCEGNKCYLDITSCAYMIDERQNREELTKRRAEDMAYEAGKEIMYDEQRGISHYSYNRYIAGKREQTEVVFEALENIKTKLDLLDEFGFMGVAFDIMRVPVEYLMMFHTMFTRPIL